MKVIVGVVVVLIILFLASNTARNNKNNVSMEVEEFKKLLSRERLSGGLVNFSSRIIEELQREDRSGDKSIISHKVLKRLKGWNYSKVLHEREYKKIYSRHKSEIDRLYQEAMDDYSFSPKSVGGGEYTKKWSKEAQMAEVAITKKISDVMHRR